MRPTGRERDDYLDEAMTGCCAALRRALLVAACLIPIVTARAQDAYVPLRAAAEPALGRPVSITVRDVALGVALGRVARAARVDFVLDGTVPELLTPVTLSLERTTLREAILALIATAAAQDRVEIVVSRPATLIVRSMLSPTDRRSRHDAADAGVIAGVIHDAVTGSPVFGADVVIDADPWVARTDRAGRFAVSGIPPGAHTVVVRRLGFAPLRIPGISVGSRERRDVAVTLHPIPLRLDQRVVTTATYSAFSEPVRPPVITRDHLERIPHFGGDAFRAIAGMPGVSTDDFSSKLHVRGGSGDDLRIALDGVELIDPYHLRAVGGMFSLVDAHAVGSMTLAAGDVGAEHGNQLSGVLAIQSLGAEESRSRAEAVADVHHVSVTSHGRLPRTRGSWLVTGRYGFPDVILHRANVTGDVSARFADLFAKASLGRGADTITLHTLLAGDRLHRRVDERSYVNDAASHRYLWATGRSRIGDRTTVRMTASVGRLRGSLNGIGVASMNEPFVTYLPAVSVADRRTARVAALRQDWRVAIADRWLATWGGDLAWSRSTHVYALDSTPASPSGPSNVSSATRLRRAVAPHATSGGVYTSHRLRLTDRMIADVGVRYDAQNATHERVWSPRVNGSYAVSPRTIIRGGWGRYAQFERPFDIDLAHADTVLDRGDRAEHRALGLEHESSVGVTVRVEVYDRIQSRVRPRFYHAPSSASLFPQLTEAPLRLEPEWRRARGVEVSASSRQGATLGWMASYATAVGRERVSGTTVRGSFDDRHAARLEWWYAYRRTWHVGAAWRYRSGWAATDRTLDVRLEHDTAGVAIALGPYNAREHGRYSRLDLRLERAWQWRGGTLAVFADLYNALDQLNTHAVERAEYVAVTAGDAQTPASVDRVSEASPVPMLDPLLTVGIRWKR